MISKKALGLIETVGLAAAVEAADKALKTANVELIGYELSKGGGMVTVKIAGDVSAVSAAMASARLSAEAVRSVVSVKVITRPDEQLEKIVLSKETVGIHSKEEAEQEQEELQEADQESTPDVSDEQDVQMDEEYAEKEETETVVEMPLEDKTSNILEIREVQEQKNAQVSCNLCHDPQCSRKKGEPRTWCIHENIKEKTLRKEN